MTDEVNSDRRRLWNRRRVLEVLASSGVGTFVFQRALAAQVEDKGVVTSEMISQAEWISGLELSEDERASAARSVQSSLRNQERMRAIPIDYDVHPALLFYADPIDGVPKADSVTAEFIDNSPGTRAEDDDLAFMPIARLAPLLRTRQVSAVELTKLYLDRLHREDERLHCVVTFTDDLALRQAEQADQEIAAGNYRGLLHGIPWGAKDLIAYPGYPTTWGAPQFRSRELSAKATVAERLDREGSILLAKLSLGALAQGDKWFGQMTRNPWNIEEGSSGSSAGSAAATAAGLVGFALGSETLGSIVSPSRRCGTSGLRPTYGRVSRHGCMTLSWSMDKLGPICRSVEDCAIVFAAICGTDARDATVVDREFRWPSSSKLKDLKVGYFEQEGQEQSLAVLRDLGVQLVPIQLPDSLPTWAMTTILDVEAATVFDDLTRNRVTEGLNRWPETFRKANFVPAVEYVRANRLRTLLMRQMADLMKKVDLYLDGEDLAITNLTGHPSIVIPGELIERRGHQVPSSIKFTGRLFGESQLLAVAHAFQEETGYHRKRPPQQT